MKLQLRTFCVGSRIDPLQDRRCLLGPCHEGVGLAVASVASSWAMVFMLFGGYDWPATLGHQRVVYCQGKAREMPIRI